MVDDHNRWTLGELVATKKKEKQSKVEETLRKEKEKANKSTRKVGKVGRKMMEKEKGPKERTTKGKGKGKSKSKGKSDQKGKGQSNNPHAGKQCRTCGKYGRIAESCWWKVSCVECQSGAQSSQEPKTEVKGLTGSSSSVAAIHEGYDHDKVIFTVDDGAKVAAVSASDGCKLLLDDSGACENVAKNGDF